MSSIAHHTAFAREVPRTRPELVLAPPVPLRVVIADAQPVVRAGFTAMLDSEADISVSAEASGAEEVVALAAELSPDVVLLDLELPGIGGLEAARRILEAPNGAHVNVLILASRDGDEDLFAALRVGARGFVLKSTDPAGLAEAVRTVSAGDAHLTPSATRRLIAEFVAQPQPRLPTPAQLDELTAREREVMALVAAGLRNDEIAEYFVISPATVKTHVSRALRKLHARDRAQLVAIAYRFGLVGPGPAVRPEPHSFGGARVALIA
jgi:DNA-binding NarL/FixJ family response regulator